MKRRKFIAPPPPFAIVIDTREQHRLPFGAAVPTVVRKLYPGDYSVAGFDRPGGIVWEKKDLNDLIGTLFGKSANADGSTTPRLLKFIEELTAMRGYAVRSVIVTDPLRKLTDHLYQSRVEPPNVLRLMADITAATGVTFRFFDSPAQAAAVVTAEALQFWEVRNGLSSIRYTLKKMRSARIVPDRGGDGESTI